MTELQSKFLAAYLDPAGPGFLCATRAARVAGYRWPGKSGPRLMTDPTVARLAEAGFQAVLREDDRGRKCM